MTKVYKFSHFYSWKNSTIYKNTIPTKKEIMTKVYKFSHFYSWQNSTIHKNTIPIPTKKETITNIEQTHGLRLHTDTNTNFM